jgi:hypothetical protein
LQIEFIKELINDKRRLVSVGKLLVTSRGFLWRRFCHACLPAKAGSFHGSVSIAADLTLHLTLRTEEGAVMHHFKQQINYHINFESWRFRGASFHFQITIRYLFL